MDILPVNFGFLRLCGVWNEWEGGNFIARFLGFCYRYAIVILTFHFTACEIIELFLPHDGIEDVTEALYMTLTYVPLCLKYGNFLARRDEISALLDCFRLEVCRSRNPEEKQLLEDYKRKAKRSSILFMTMAQITGVALLAVPLLNLERTERPLPLKTYLPYSIADTTPYLATYCHQVVAVTYGALLNISFDSLVYGFTLHVCGQIELLCHRIREVFGPIESNDPLSSSSSKSRTLDGCVRHHVLVHELVHRIQSLFVWCTAVLFCFSLITLCTSIFRISKKTLISMEFLSMILYLGSVLFQIFSYCWYGNELELKSKGVGDAAYSSNWIAATVQDRKSLLIVMTISQRGLVLSYYGIFALALHTFTWIVNTSYSAFNLLQSVSD